MSYALEINGLKKTYDNGFEALKGIDLAVETGDFFALLGPMALAKAPLLEFCVLWLTSPQGQSR